ncbi:MAG: substrate-binding domain-containing protein [Lentisphaeria bacterium]|nr:substrate-binding domain-containing protein [Lentisphaeria bacterium]
MHYEYDPHILRGVLAFLDQVDNWRFIRAGTLPYIEAKDLDPGRVDGMLGRFVDMDWAEVVAKSGVPAVNFSSCLEEVPQASVVSDDAAIGRLGGEHFLERGFDRFGFVSLTANWYSRCRLAAFRNVVENRAGCTCDVLEVSSANSDETTTALRNWLSGIKKPMAVMAVTDMVGCQVINMAIELGLRVPDDVAVLGVDHDQWAAVLADIPLSTIEVDKYTIGYRAAQVLVNLMDGESPPPTQRIKPVGLIQRRSTDIMLAQTKVATDALRFIREYCTEGIEVGDIVDHLLVSRRSLEMHLKKAVGLTPRQAIQRARIEKVKAMLINSDMTIKEIAHACGFRQPPRLNIVFRRLTGMTPGSYRQIRNRLVKGNY